MKIIRSLLLVSCFLGLSVGLATAQAEITITITDLGTLGGQDSRARGINDFGQVVGYSETADGSWHAFLWTAESGMTDLGTLGGSYSDAYGINDFGQVVGYSETADGSEHAFLWTAESGMNDLGTLGDSYSAARSINNFGQVVGRSLTTGGTLHAFVWTAESGMIDLGAFEGPYSFSEAWEINNLGQVVGWSSIFNGVWNSFLWTEDAGMIDLNEAEDLESGAFGINELGHVVGFSRSFDGPDSFPFIWTAESGMTDLGTLGGIRHNIARGINDYGQVVGNSDTVDGSNHAFLWTAESGMIDLGTLGGLTSIAFGINNLGQVVGASDTSEGYTHATSWTVTFPSNNILDDFNRADGPIGENWTRYTSKYRISSNQLRVRSSGSNTDIYWHEAFGADQEAFFTFAQTNETVAEQDLLLKSQSQHTWGDGVLEVLYDAPGHNVQVWTWEWPQGWVKYGDDIPVTFMVGDTFKARARADGIVEVYRNGTLLGTRDVTSWSHYDKGGYIGLWFIGARNTIIDDFGGGTVPDGTEP